MSVSAQTGSVTGRIADKRTALGIKNAHVTLLRSGSTSAKTSKSGACGNYTLGNIEAGSYSVAFSYNGYKTDTISGVIVSEGKVTFLNDELIPAVAH